MNMRDEIALRYLEKNFVTKNVNKFNAPLREDLAASFRFADIFMLWAADREFEAIELAKTDLVYPARKCSICNLVFDKCICKYED